MENKVQSNISASFVNKKRINLLKKFCGDDVGIAFEKAFESTFENILDTIDEKTLKFVNFVTMIDNINDINDDNLPDYTLGNKKVHVIRNEKDLIKAVEQIKKSKVVGFDTEQKPIFTKGVPPSKIAIIQISDNKNCYIFQVHLIRNIRPVLDILSNSNIVKVGIGLNGDISALYNEFKVRLNACIDFGALFKAKMYYSNDIGAKRGVLLFLNQKLQKSKRISRSNWESEKLSDMQIKYASEDAACVHDMFCTMLVKYPFLVEILPHSFQDRYYKNYYDELLEDFKDFE